MLIELSWTDFKTNITDRNLPVQYYTEGIQYHVLAFDGPMTFKCIVEKDETPGADQVDFETNYKPTANGTLTDHDQTGRPIIRYAATIKGWHYQAHAFEFETCKLNSIYNKDENGNDLGYCDIKFYDDQGTELTTQVSINSDCVKTVVTWKPDFDFEIISGNIRQVSREQFNMYTHVAAKIATGYPAPFDWFRVPFTNGGINMKYIGADEPLKTDGRASKLITASNGDHFEVIINHDPGNQHQMTLIMEIYKDPQS